jgi:hypothetical protein
VEGLIREAPIEIVITLRKLIVTSSLKDNRDRGNVLWGENDRYEPFVLALSVVELLGDDVALPSGSLSLPDCLLAPVTPQIGRRASDENEL